MNFTDSIIMDGVRVTSAGYLVSNAKVAAIGIQTYRGYEVGKPEKDWVRVFRSEDEVFARDAMASFAHLPCCNDHPAEMITSENWKLHCIGFTSGDIARDQGHLRVPLMLTDASAVAAVKAGKMALSAGYRCDLDWTPGTTASGDQYDAKQLRIRANHVALVDVARGAGCCLGDGWTNPASTKDHDMDDARDARQAYVDYLEDAYRGGHPAERRPDPAAVFEASARAAVAANQRILARRPDAGAGYSELRSRLSDAWRAA